MVRRGVNFHAGSVYAPVVWLLVFSLFGNAGTADEIQYDGETIQGTVADITSTAVEFKTPYGTLTIPLEKVDALTTDEPRQILHGDDDETTGRIVGLEDGRLLVGEDVGTATAVDVTTVVGAANPADIEGFFGFVERMRHKYRYWSGNLDVGASYQDKTTDEVDLTLGFNLERRKKPTRLVTGVSYLFGRDKASGEESSTTDNELIARVKGEYDLTEKIFLFTGGSYEYDELDRLSARLLGVAGPAYRFIENDDYLFQLEAGGSYVYKRFFGGDREEYPAAFFGAEGRANLGLGAVFAFRLGYLPSVRDWTADYLINADASLSFPLSTYLALKGTVRNTYDNTPDNNAQRNEVTTLLALSWRF